MVDMKVRFRGEQGVIAEGVDVTISRDHRRLDQSDNWWGEAQVPLESHVLPGHQLTMELGDGSLAPIRVERVTVDSKAGRMLIRFTGSGPLSQDGLGGS